MTYKEVAIEIIAEAKTAEERYGPFASSHEAIGVLLEEFDELREAIRGNRLAPIRREAIQVSAVALRLAHCCRNHPDFEARSMP